MNLTEFIGMSYLHIIKLLFLFLCFEVNNNSNNNNNNSNNNNRYLLDVDFLPEKRHLYLIY